MNKTFSIGRFLVAGLVPAVCVFGQTGEYRFSPSAPPGAINSVSFAREGFWSVGDSAAFRRSKVSPVEGLGPRFGWQPIELTVPSGFTGVNLTAVSALGSQTYLGSGSPTPRVGNLFVASISGEGTSASLSLVNDGNLNLGKVTDLLGSGSNLIRFGDRFAIGHYAGVRDLSNESPFPLPRATGNVSPFFENYSKGVQIGNLLFVGGQFAGGAPRGAISFSADFGVSITPTAPGDPLNGVTLFDNAKTTKILSLATDGFNLYVSGDKGFLAVLRVNSDNEEGGGGGTFTALPPENSPAWKTTTVGADVLSMAVHGDWVYLASSSGISRRPVGESFIGSAEVVAAESGGNSLAIAKNGPLQDLIVAVGANGASLGGPVPEVANVAFEREHFFDSNKSLSVTVNNPVDTTTRQSWAFDFYKNAATGVPFHTVQPSIDNGARTFDLVSKGTGVFNYGTNDIVVVTRDVRTGVTGATTSFRLYRWPNPGEPSLGRSSEAAETNHYLQVGYGYSQPPAAVVESKLVPTTVTVESGAGGVVAVNTTSANWFRLTTAVGQTGANPVLNIAELLSNGATSLVQGATSLTIPTNLSAGVYTFAAQAIAPFPVADGVSTNGLSTNVTLFNVVVLMPPTKPDLSFTQWTVGACQNQVINTLLTKTNGNWLEAMANPQSGALASLLSANISKGTWFGVATNQDSAILKFDAANPAVHVDTYQVGSVSNNRDGGDSVSLATTTVELTVRPTPRAPGLRLDDILSGVNGIPTATDYVVNPGGNQRIKVGGGVVTRVVIQPTPALELQSEATQLEWTLTQNNGPALELQTVFSRALTNDVTQPGHYEVVVRSRNHYNNTEAFQTQVGGAVLTRAVATHCGSLDATSLVIDVSERPEAPGVSATNVARYVNGAVVLGTAATNQVETLRIGHQSTRPTYKVEPQTRSGDTGFTSLTGDWYVADAAFSPIGAPLATNETELIIRQEATTPTVGVLTNRYVVRARTTDGSLSLGYTRFQLEVTPVPNAPEVLASEFFSYESGTLTQRDNVDVANNGKVTVGDNSGDPTRLRPVFSFKPQDNVLGADWYLNGIQVATNQPTFKPTQVQAGVGTNLFVVNARSKEGSASVATSFALIVTPAPSAPVVEVTLPSFSPDGLTSTVVKRTVVAGESVFVGTQAALPKFQVLGPAGLVPAFTRWTVDQQLILTNANFTPTLKPGSNTIEAVGYSAEGTRGQTLTFTVVVMAPPKPPTFVKDSIQVGDCDTKVTFTAVADGPTASIFWTTTPVVGAGTPTPSLTFDTAVNLAARVEPYRYYAWAVSTNGDVSVSAVASLTVEQAPPAAELKGLTKVEGIYTRAVAVDAPAYPQLEVTNVLEGDIVRWYSGETLLGTGSTIVLSTNDLPTNVAKEYTLRVEVVRLNCTNKVTQLKLVVDHPFLSLERKGGSALQLYYLTAGDSEGKTLELLSSVDPSGQPATTNSVTIPAATSTNAIGIIKYLILDDVPTANAPVFYRAPKKP